MAEEENQQSNKLPQEQEQPPPGPIPRSFESMLGGNSPAKTEWPELVGLTAQEAEPKVKEDMPGAHVQVVPPDCFVTMDFNMQRVRLYMNASGKIERPPRLG